MPGFASLSVASLVQVASLNLCTDEYLLLLAHPAEIASVTRLAQDRHESILWRLARAFPANRGAVEQVIARRPTLLLTMGGGGKSTLLLAGKLGIPTIDLPFPASVGDVAANMRRVAAALGDQRRANPWLARLAGLRATKPDHQRDAIFVSGGGTSLSPGSPSIEWMALSGLAQRRLPGARADLETLLVRPPAVLVRSAYRRGQMAHGNRWLDHPIVTRLARRTIVTDGRAWTCAGPLMLDEVERMRRVRR